MLSLPLEVQLHILKYLNFNELFAVKQTNYYFYSLINKYEGELARMKFFNLSIIDANQKLDSYKSIDLQSGVFEFTLNDELRKKWQTAIGKSIPVFIGEYDIEYDIEPLLCMATADNHCCYYILKLPTIPKNIEEMIIVRCWLERLLTCSFDHCIFNKIVFNREMLNILFETPPKFHVNKPSLSPNKNTFENMLDFIMNHLANTSFLAIKFIYYDNAEQYINILFNILINEGDKFPRISLRRGKLTRLYELIVEFITTATDFSKMIAKIELNYMRFPNFKLPERAENVQIGELDVFDKRYTRYEIANMYDSRMKFAFTIEYKKGSISGIDITKMNV